MGGHPQEPLPRFADLATLDDGPAAPDPRPLLHTRRHALAHPLSGLRTPWSREWASGGVDGSPLSPWWRLGGLSRIATAMIVYPGRRATEMAEVREKRQMMGVVQTVFEQPGGRRG